MGRTPQARQYYHVRGSNSVNFPYMVIDTKAEIYNIAIRLMDETRNDAGPSFAVTTDADGNWQLWLTELSKQYIIGD